MFAATTAILSFFCAFFNAAAKQIRDDGSIRDTMVAIEETTKATKGAVHEIKAASREAADLAPETAKNLSDAAKGRKGKVTEAASKIRQKGTA